MFSLITRGKFVGEGESGVLWVDPEYSVSVPSSLFVRVLWVGLLQGLFVGEACSGLQGLPDVNYMTIRFL